MTSVFESDAGVVRRMFRLRARLMGKSREGDDGELSELTLCDRCQAAAEVMQLRARLRRARSRPGGSRPTDRQPQLHA